LLRKAKTSVDDLDLLRIEDRKSLGNHLWTTAYTGDRTVLASIPDLSPAIDTLASRNAMQTLLAMCLLGEAEETTPMLREASAALAKLPREKGAFRRRYDLHTDPHAPPPAPPPANENAPPTSPLFDAPAPAPTESQTAAGVDEVIRAVERLQELGPDPYRKALSARLPVEHRLALVMCGMGDEALTAEEPPAIDRAKRDESTAAMLQRMAWLAWQLPAQTTSAQPDRDER
jgi:hypothetical protein